jgi:outer membrane autotransporter protein
LLGGELDVRDYQQVLPSLNIAGGILRAESDNPLSVEGDLTFTDGRIVAYLNNGSEGDGANAPIVANTFSYVPGIQRSDSDHGIYAVVNQDGASDSNVNGTWKVIGGEVNDINALASKTFLVFPVTDGQQVDPDQVIEVDGTLYSVANFAGLNIPLDAASLKTIILEEGSLNIVVEDKSKEEIIEDISEDQSERFGCEGLEELCDGLEEPEVGDLLDLVLPVAGESGLAEKLPVLQWGQLAKLLGSGLTPRNVDAAPRGMQTYNNVLADTVFERHPLRQYQKLEEKTVIIANDLSSVKDSSAVDQDLLDPAVENVLTFDGNQYLENPSLTAQYAERDGVRGWFRGFGANNRSYGSTTLNNDYSLYTGGFAIGADVSLSESFQLGAYANYGDVNVVQGGVTGGGSWNPDGWGGGVTADYWTDNFYVQGLLGATGYSATQSRGISNLEKEWGGDTATASKNATSYVGALRIGAPFESGSLLLEPQFTGIWTQNQENNVSESGVREGLRLRYGSRTTNYLQTGLGMKFSWPIDSGDRNQLVPSLKVAWLADWDLGNDGQSIGYKFTDREVEFEPKQETQNGALIEVGLDYTIANINKMSVKLYANGGAELWGGDRGTTWRGSGGVTFQF